MDPPLHGVRVVDFTQALSGPYCAMLLGDLGADVLKIERPDGGDDSRGWGPPFVDDTASYFLAVNRNKRSVVLDLKCEDGRETALHMIEAADVVVENWRPGTARRLGLHYEKAAERRPDIVYCSISGYGAESTDPGYDQVVQGTSGWMSLTGAPDGDPVKTGVPIGDVASGMFAANAISAALVRRERTGKGAFVDIAMQDCLLSMLVYHAGTFLTTGEPPRRHGNQHSTVAPYATFETADGQVNIAVGNDRQWARLCSELGIPALATDPRFIDNPARSRNRAVLYQELGDVVRQLTKGGVLAAAKAAGVPAGPINDLREALMSDHSRQRRMVLEAEHPRLGRVRSVGAPWHLDGETAPAYRPPPDLGQHTSEVLESLGLAPGGTSTEPPRPEWNDDE